MPKMQAPVKIREARSGCFLAAWRCCWQTGLTVRFVANFKPNIGIKIHVSAFSAGDIIRIRGVHFGTKILCVDLTQTSSSVMVPALWRLGCPKVKDNQKRPKSRDEKNGVAREIAPPLSISIFASRTVGRPEQIALVRLRNERQSDDRSHRCDDDRVPEPIVDIAGLSHHRE
jgi:hypothetical protein